MRVSVYLLLVKPPTVGNIQFEYTKCSPFVSLMFSDTHNAFHCLYWALLSALVLLLWQDQLSSLIPPPSVHTWPLQCMQSEMMVWGMAWQIFHIKQGLYPCFNLLFILKADWHLRNYHGPSQQKVGAIPGWRQPKQGFLHCGMQTTSRWHFCAGAGKSGSSSNGSRPFWVQCWTHTVYLCLKQNPVW